MDDKEKLINDIAMKMALNDQDTNKLKNMLYMELYNYSVIPIKNTEVAVTDESISEEIYRMYFVAKRVQGCTNRTIEYYANVLKQFFTKIQKPVTQVTTNDIRYFLAIKKERDGNGDTNVDNYRRVLNSFFGWAVEEEYINKNPVAKVKKVRMEKYVKKAFKDIEIERMRICAQEDVRLAALLEVLMSTGARISEVSNMNREDIDGDEIIVKGKGKKERIVYLNAKARIALQRYLDTRKDNDPALFVSMHEPHRRVRISGLGIMIRKLGQKANVQDTHPHRFRRTAATMALNRGMPIDQVQLMLGHESIETTTIYAASAQEAVKASHKKYVV